ncbi:hypothetical protein CapIbe_012373 [Capra ibex]
MVKILMLWMKGTWIPELLLGGSDSLIYIQTFHFLEAMEELTHKLRALKMVLSLTDCRSKDPKNGRITWNTKSLCC